MKGKFVKGKKDDEWYLIIEGSIDVLRGFLNVFKSIRDKIENANDDVVEYDRNCMKIKFISNDDLLVDKTVDLHLITIVIRAIFAQNGKYYPQLFLDDAIYDEAI